ncbi:MFS transporter [Leptolinea sp. HRD-7]|nr:MFS transporter [Leptolinea sp. HRD-7]
MDSTKYSGKWLVLLSVSFGVFLATIDSSIVNISLPTFVKELNTSLSSVQWVVLSYLLTITVLMPGIGRLADILGKKSLYILGFSIFLTGSLLCGISTQIQWLIVFRILQAIGGAFIMALGPALLAQSFPPDERGRALGINGLAVSLGIICGPTLGGIILQNLSWHWIFFVNLPVGAIAIPIALSYLPESHRNHGEYFDLTGAFLLFLTLSSLLFSMTFAQSSGLVSFETIGLLLLCLVFLMIFIQVEKRVRQPVIDLKLFSNQILRINLITGFLTFVASAGLIFLMPFYLQNVLGYNPQLAGMLMAVFPVMLGITGPISGWLSDRFGFHLLTVTGLGILSIGYFGLIRLTPNTSAIEFALIYLPIGLGMGLFQSPNNSSILSAASAGRLGVVSSLLAITRTLGQTCGTAIIGSIWAILVIHKSGIGGSGLNNVTLAPVVDQVYSLHIVAAILGFLLFIATILSLLIWLKEYRNSKINIPST